MTSRCLNCDAVVLGPWCQDCGQKDGAAHRSLLHLGAELLEMVSHADGRFWRTLRRLAVDPAALSRDYLAGRRASEIPPLRLFFAVMLVAFTLGSITRHGQVAAAPTSRDRAEIQADLAGTLTGWAPLDAWLRPHVEQAVLHPDSVIAVMRDWSERLAVCMVPIAGLMLWALYASSRRFLLFDHLLVSIHSLSFVGLVLSAMALLELIVPGVSGLVLLVLPLHLFKHLRGVYGGSKAGTLVRMALLGAGTTVSLGLLLLGLIGLGLQLGAAA